MTAASCGLRAGATHLTYRAATGLAAATQQHGAGGVGMFSCSKSTNEMNYAAQKFMRTVLKSNNIDSCNRT